MDTEEWWGNRKLYDNVGSELKVKLCVWCDDDEDGPYVSCVCG